MQKLTLQIAMQYYNVYVFDATRCHILRPKCIKFDFRQGSQLALSEALEISVNFILYLRGILLMGGKEKKGEREMGRKGMERRRNGIRGKEVERGRGP